MVVRRYKNSSEEIFASFKIVANSTTTIYNRVISPNSIFSNDFPKEDTKTTLKVSCGISVKIIILSKIIYSLRYFLFVGVSDLDVDRLRLLCNSAISHPPTINHYSIDGCCTVPPELVEFAKERDIQLLTHNDTRNLVIKDEVRGLVENISGRDMVGYENGWTAR
uniref:GCS light chain n=1 Tax=Heterorhabditis bacteriophora TaxID=37862 RepID=A0A1I7XG97_HETBA